MDKVNKEIKILHITTGASGGIGKMVLELIREQKKDTSLMVDVLIGRMGGHFYEDILRAVSKCYNLGLKSGFELNPLKLIKSISIMKEYDVLHFHNFSLSLAIASIFAKRPILYTIHGCPYQNYSAPFVFKCKEFMKNVLCGIYLRNFSAYITANSDFTRKSAVKFFHLSPRNIGLVYNGMDFCNIFPGKKSQEVRAGLGIPKKRFVVGTVVNFGEQSKRIDRLVNGFLMFPHYKDSLLLLIGWNKERLPIRVKKSINENRNNILLIGFQPDIYDFMQIMDIFILPSHGEPFGLVILEALGLGVSVVVFSDGGGAVEIVKDSGDYFIVKNEKELAQKLNEFYLKKDVKKRVKSLIKCVKKRFDISQTHNNFKKIYQRFID